MRLLLDTCTWSGMMPALKAAGHDVVHAGAWPSDPGDLEILRVGFDEKRIVVTLDKDFGELAIVNDIPHAGIIRIVGGSVLSHGSRVLAALSRYGDDLYAGAIVTIEENRTRFRPAP